MLRALGSWTLVLLLAGAGPAPDVLLLPERASTEAVGVIEGVMELERRPARRVAQRYPGAGSGSSQSVQPVAPVVFLRGAVEGSGRGAAAPGSGASGDALAIAQRDTTFQPSLLVVRRGQTVEFPNRDPFFHNVFSYSGAARFDLGRYPEGESKSVTFREPGIVRIYCEVHDFMRAAVIVTENPYHARPDAEGRFRISGVPPGTYTLVGWDADRGTVTEEVTVSEGGRVEVVLEMS